ncbi:hypothetical protein F7725_023127 [Dissostichus mawsoni]|uniref:Uncharacterized protein n=1 Tax=Dissostichus mawsoni TaxID=36200 RepID=A0A7J5YZR1_DISMA|nr:hypothetical protein F7725_023127 [Dissostichus mawsoni]
MFTTYDYGTLLDLHTNGTLSAGHFTQTCWRESIRKPTQRAQVQIMNNNMYSRQRLIAEMELVHTLSKLTPEERKVEVRRQMYVELKAVEMERRQTAALETLAKSERDREETQKVTESLKKAAMEKDRRRQEENQLKQERLQWQQVMLKGVKTPTHNFIALNEEQEKRREEAYSLTPDLKSPERKIKLSTTTGLQRKKWTVGLSLMTPPISCLLPNQTQRKTAEVKENLQSMQKDRLSVGHWVGLYHAMNHAMNHVMNHATNHAMKHAMNLAMNHALEKRRLKAEAQHDKCIASKSHGPKNTLLNGLLDCKKAFNKKSVYNNWLAEKAMDSQRDPDRLSVGHWVGKYQQNHEKKREKRRLKAEAQHAKYIASKSHGPQNSLLNELLDWSVVCGQSLRRQGLEPGGWGSGQWGLTEEDWAAAYERRAREEGTTEQETIRCWYPTPQLDEH